ncbi:hypothetical protein CBM2637_A200263 [Cupriavidus taiwanensis]|nr:hypothetical protein CBM2637_A200263 [Cupriavidus taiwanensis]
MTSRVMCDGYRKPAGDIRGGRRLFQKRNDARRGDCGDGLTF